MAKYRKKPVVIEAFRWSGDAEAMKEWLAEVRGYEESVQCPTPMQSVVIRTLEGEMHASLGDWIIKGIKGEFYPCKPDIFEATYDAV